MINSISGIVSQKSDNAITIEVSGLGIEVFVTHDTVSELTVGHTAFLHTHFIVREDSMALYGFKNLEEKTMFIHFLGVGGVGPKSAMSILSTLSMDNIRRAILSEEPDFFSKVPGIGKKTAQKILIHMQGKVPAMPGESYQKTSDVDDSVIDALINLGYSVVEAQAAVQALPKDTPDTIEEKLRLTLQYFDH
ncbi:MAG TPA: Holliday junction branch migration protein RuvA [Anaerolineaceae bacterium]|jgi:Holliday junction DNA helicase RuvA|nr:Holliday junction branch migration protein RuvA [Chloroflexota bacterium]HPL82485.1 Holliday junction branch migration protein RuvA [Anaerolineaceae bacterium]